METIPLVSVIIPTFNHMPEIGDAVRALFEQEYPFDRYEIIVVDDGSTDDTAACINGLQKRAPCTLRYVSQKNKGPAAARNQGIRQARGSIIAFLDADARASKCWIAEISRGYDDAAVAGVGGLIKADPGDSLVSRYCAFQFFNQDPVMDNQGVRYLITGNASFRKEYVKEIGGFDERYHLPGGEDLDISYRLRKQGYCFQYSRHAVTCSRHKESLHALLKSYFNYGIGCSSLELRMKSSWDLVSCRGYRRSINAVKTILKSASIAFKCLRTISPGGVMARCALYYGRGGTLHHSLAYAFFDHAKTFHFQRGFLAGYITGRLKGFKKDNKNYDYLK